jgi:hypothetical protein
VAHAPRPGDLALVLAAPELAARLAAAEGLLADVLAGLRADRTVSLLTERRIMATLAILPDSADACTHPAHLTVGRADPAVTTCARCGVVLARRIHDGDRGDP